MTKMTMIKSQGPNHNDLGRSSLDKSHFSWSDIHEIHGDYMRKTPAFLKTNQASAPPSLSVAALKYNQRVDSIHSVQLISIA
jgi:hypothetical protein